MSELQDKRAAEAPVGPTTINESEGKVWRQPMLTTWEVPEETQGTPAVSGVTIMVLTQIYERTQEMTKLQDTQAAEAPVDPTQINEAEGKVWRRPTLTTWKAPEVTEMPKISGEMAV